MTSATVESTIADVNFTKIGSADVFSEIPLLGVKLTTPPDSPRSLRSIPYVGDAAKPVNGRNYSDHTSAKVSTHLVFSLADLRDKENPDLGAHCPGENVNFQTVFKRIDERFAQMEKAIAEAERKRKQEQREFLDNLQEAMEAAMKQAMEATKQTMEATKQAMEAVFDKERASNSLFSSSSSTSSTSSTCPAKKTRKN